MTLNGLDVILFDNSGLGDGPPAINFFLTQRLLLS
jgi:hypothetical protein